MVPSRRETKADPKNAESPAPAANKLARGILFGVVLSRCLYIKLMNIDTFCQWPEAFHQAIFYRSVCTTEAIIFVFGIACKSEFYGFRCQFSLWVVLCVEFEFKHIYILPVFFAIFINNIPI